jgi:hypothetical protein
MHVLAATVSTADILYSMKAMLDGNPALQYKSKYKKKVTKHNF